MPKSYAFVLAFSGKSEQEVHDEVRARVTDIGFTHVTYYCNHTRQIEWVQNGGTEEERLIWIDTKLNCMIRAQ